MPAERLNMRRVREILRYRFEQGLGHKAISYRVGGGAPSTVRETLRRVAVAGLGWPLGEDVSDAVLGACTYGSVRSILDNRLDQAPAPRPARDDRAITHPNIRGSSYYH